MALEPITTSGPTITVSTSEELKEAYDLLSHQDGGGTILLESGQYGDLSIYTYGATDGDQPVVIASADPEAPAEFTELYIREATNIRFENILVDSTALGSGSTDLIINNSSNIQIVDSVFQFDTDNTIKDQDELAGVMSYIHDSSGILIAGNLIEGYLHGLQVVDVTDSSFDGNEFTNIQGDGFRGGGLQNVTINENYMHDFYGVDQNITHSDMIQIWGASVDLLTTDLTISGNILLASDDAASQSIFIRNEEFGKAGDPTSGYYQNITITDNLIYNGVRWGIHLDNVANSIVDNNTVLWNPDAQLMWGDDGSSVPPEIFVRNSLNVSVTDNIAEWVYVEDGSGTASGNQLVNYDNPGADNYVDSHFLNVLNGNSGDLRDLFMRPDSPWYGVVGSSYSYVPTDGTGGDVLPIIMTIANPEDTYEVTFSAAYSMDADGWTADDPGYSYHWTFADGSTADGISVTRVFDGETNEGVSLEIHLAGEIVGDLTRSFVINTQDIFALDFEDGVVDTSEGAPVLINEGDLVSSEDGTGFLIGDGNRLLVGPETETLGENYTFGIALDVTPTGDDNSGLFLDFYNTMWAKVLDDGRVSYSLTTDEGTYELISQGPIFDDGETHRIGIAFNGNTGQLELFADGASVSSTEAWGVTADHPSYHLILGYTFGDSMDAILDNVVMSTDPSVAGDLPAIDPPAEDPPAEDPPAEDPPAEDPPAEDPPAEDLPAEDPPAEDPPAEDPPAEDPPAEDPPAEDPPAEDPPAEDPPAEDPPADDPGDRGDPPEEVESDSSSNILSKFIEKFLAMFGLGKGGKKAAEIAEEYGEAQYTTTLADVVPVTETLEDDVVATEEDNDEFADLAA